MKKTGLNILFIIALSVGILSCDTDDTCRKSRTVLLGMNFYLDSINSKTNQLVVQNLAIDSLWIKGEGLDKYFYSKESKNSVKLPLNSFAQESKYMMRFNETIDTVLIKHQNFTEFLSLECGYIRTHKIDTVISTNNFIDSISINQENVGTIYVENIQIHHNK
ncbi:MAG: hypothetical protein GX361_03740 [Bacteroidales bacterium]|nr:hypothetical protein [Bacteroidales bacterium]